MLYIKINVTNERYQPGKRLSKGFPQEYAEDFAKYMAKILRKEYKKAIEKQRYSYKWKPLSIPYIKYKKVHHLSLKIWKATGLLEKSIVYRKRNGYYMVGIDPSKHYSKNNIQVLQIAKYMEYGTSKMPARPLFRPLLTYTRKHINKYWQDFLKEENKKVKNNKKGN